MNVLCIDGYEEDLRQTASVCVQTPGVDSVAMLTDTEEAAAWMDGHPVDLVLTEVWVGGEDGIAFAASLRELRPDTEVIFLARDGSLALEAYAAHPLMFLT